MDIFISHTGWYDLYIGFSLYSVMLVCDYLRWERVSILRHSLGSVISFLYASTFPNKCDMYIALDFAKGLQNSHEANVRNRQLQEPPSYKFNELLMKIKSGIFMKIGAAPYILERSVLPSAKQPKKVLFCARQSIENITLNNLIPYGNELV